MSIATQIQSDIVSLLDTSFDIDCANWNTVSANATKMIRVNVDSITPMYEFDFDLQDYVINISLWTLKDKETYATFANYDKQLFNWCKWTLMHTDLSQDDYIQAAIKLRDITNNTDDKWYRMDYTFVVHMYDGEVSSSSSSSSSSTT